MQEEEEEKLERRMGLYDLLAVGIGGTVGSGVFVLAGEIANAPDLPAGPSVVLSFAAAGLGCVLSGLSFAELASRIHADGSSYIYAYVNLGEVFAFVAGWYVLFRFLDGGIGKGKANSFLRLKMGQHVYVCPTNSNLSPKIVRQPHIYIYTNSCLTLEYGLSSSAVARNWGDKLGAWVNHMHPHDASKGSVWHPGSGEATGFFRDFNIYAGAIELVCMCIMLRGLNLSKMTVDVVTVAKLLLVVFMTIGGFTVFKPRHLEPFAPSGFRGIFRGGTRCFFGYLGFDEVCCMGGEAKNPSKNIPLAVMGTISVVTVLYVLAALALVGMQPFADISPSSGFAEAFRYNKLGWAANVVTAGELLTLPLVVLVSLLAQPRLQFAMATDGLLPAVFAHVDRNGNLFRGTLIAGLAGVVVALFLPFRALEDVISAGVLLAFNLTNSSLIVVRRIHPTRPSANRILVLFFNILALGACFMWQNLGTALPWLPLNVLVTVAAVVPLVLLQVTCPDHPSQDGHFTTPFVPWVPALGAAFNWFLLTQLSWEGLGLVLAYLGASLFLYATYGFRNSKGGRTGWREVLSASVRRHSRHSSEVDPQLMEGLLGEGDEQGEEGSRSGGKEKDKAKEEEEEVREVQSDQREASDNVSPEASPASHHST